MMCETRLQKLMDAGTIYLEDGVYYAIASDGKEVSLGNQGYEESLERYLADFPTPEHW